MAKTVRILLKDKSKCIPVVLRDPFLEKEVTLEPDGYVSAEFAKLLTDEFPFLYGKIDSKEQVDVSEYRYREDFKKEEFNVLFDKLTPDEKTYICGHVQELIDNRDKVASVDAEDTKLNTDNVKTDNGTTE